MGLKPDEIVSLWPDILEVITELIGAFGPDSEGGKKLKGSELRSLGIKLIKLGAKLVVDVID